MSGTSFESEAVRLVDDRVRALSGLSFDAASGLPEAEGEDVVAAGTKFKLGTFRQNLPTTGTAAAVLVVVQVARNRALGIASYHLERGLVFVPGARPREATAAELRDSGG